ncbi:MAG: Lpg1974 family pore-forming outer membrane protein [Waddliaceae bacterium]
MKLQIQRKIGFFGLIIGIIGSLGALPELFSGCHCTPCYGLSLGVEGLYWTVHQTNLDYAVDFDPTDTDKILGKGKTHFIDYDWKAGARGTIAYKWCEWDIKGVYTRYENHAKDHINTENSDIDLKASMLHPGTGLENGEKATGKSDLDYYTVDLLFGRELCLCSGSVNLHPFFGVRGLRIDQHLKVDYEGEDFVQGNAARPARVDWSSELNALGLHAGLNMFYRARCGFGLYGSFAGSLLSSLTDIRHFQKTLDANKNTISTEINLKEKEHVIVPGYHLTTGITWETCYCKRYGFNLRLAYEFNQWFDIPQLRRYSYNNEGVSGSGTSSHIGLHGATLYADLSF